MLAVWLKVLGVTNGREINIISMIFRYYSKIHYSLGNDRLLKIKLYTRINIKLLLVHIATRYEQSAYNSVIL